MRDNRRKLSSIVNRLQETKALYDQYIDIRDLNNYNPPVIHACKDCEILLSDLLKEDGIEVSKGYVILNQTNKMDSAHMGVIEFMQDNKYVDIPEVYRNFLKTIINSRKEIKDGKVFSREKMYELIRAYKCFIVWFIKNYDIVSLYKCDSESVKALDEYCGVFLVDLDIPQTTHARVVSAGTIALPAMAVASPVLAIFGKYALKPLLTAFGYKKVKQSQVRKKTNPINEEERKLVMSSLNLVSFDESDRIVSDDNTYKKEDTNATENNNKNIEELLLALMDQSTKQFEQLQESNNKTNAKLDDVSRVLKSISNQIEDYRALLQNQIELAVNEEEVERLIHAYSEITVEKMKNEIDIDQSERSRNLECEKLKTVFGDAWEKLDEESKNYLITAKITYSYYLGLKAVDYSGVCLNVSKALELEMCKRFYENYVSFLKQRYEDSYKNHLDDLPTPLIKERYGKKELIRHKDFTLGTVKYILCSEDDPDTDRDHNDNNKRKLIEFARSELMEPRLSDEQILRILSDFGKEIDTVREKYRNKAAHLHGVEQVDAEECIRLVIDVEKLLKRLLDTFNY